MIPAISQVCTLSAAFEADIADYSAAACKTVELWLGKLEAYLERHTVTDLRALLEEHGVTATVASYQGGLLTSQGDARREHWDHFGRRLELCRAVGVEILIVACDVHGPLSNEDLQRANMSLAQAADRAAEFGIQLALEFQARASLGNNLQTALAWVEQCGRPNLGICLDVFHFQNGPSKLEDLALLSPERLLHVQFSDLSGVLRETAGDADRILPGDGDLSLAAVVSQLERLGYQRQVSLELMNPTIYQIPPRQVAEVGMTALRKVLGQAAMQ